MGNTQESKEFINLDNQSITEKYGFFGKEMTILMMNLPQYGCLMTSVIINY